MISSARVRSTGRRRRVAAAASRTPASRSTKVQSPRARRARGSARSSGCSATSRRSSRSRSCSCHPRRGVRATWSRRTTPTPRHALRDAEPRPPVRHRPPRARHRSAGSSTARRCRCASGFQIVMAGVARRGAARAARRLPGRRHRRDAHAGHGRSVGVPTAGARARGRGRARRRTAERDPRHLVRDDPGLHAPDPRADARGARGDVHRGVALDRDEARPHPRASVSCPMSRRRSSSRCRSPSASR